MGEKRQTRRKSGGRFTTNGPYARCVSEWNREGIYSKRENKRDRKGRRRRRKGKVGKGKGGNEVGVPVLH